MYDREETGREIISRLGTSSYLFWTYLKARDFNLPSMEEMTRDLGRTQKTIKRWLNDLDKNGFIPSGSTMKRA